MTVVALLPECVSWLELADRTLATGVEELVFTKKPPAKMEMIEDGRKEDKKNTPWASIHLEEVNKA